MVGQSLAFQEMTRLVARLAACDAPVLIEGETGTGKELVARAIHYQSSRRECPFIPVNCGALPDSLLESELFGHRKGAFTDAKENQAGLVTLAEGGTLFLDEVDAFSVKGQVTLLRFLPSRPGLHRLRGTAGSVLLHLHPGRRAPPGPGLRGPPVRQSTATVLRSTPTGFTCLSGKAA